MGDKHMQDQQSVAADNKQEKENDQTRNNLDLASMEQLPIEN
jgi:hypothetical protein